MNWEEGFENENENSGVGDKGGGGANAIELIEEYLMKEDDDDIDRDIATVEDLDLMWLDDILLDFPLEKEEEKEKEKEKDDPSSSPPTSHDNTSEAEADPNHVIADADDGAPNFDNDNDNVSDPLSKKRKRQLRNRDAAMRSRERKKIYVKDLETKSRYLEAECRRLGRLLQCCYAENQMLRISLGSAYAASMAKPESAVLLLESLLLVSLVWLMVNMYLPRLPLLNQDAVPHASVVAKNEQESATPNGKVTKVTELWVTLSFAKSKRCRASRIKMKSVFGFAVSCF